MRIANLANACRHLIAVAIALSAVTPAGAEELCAERPGLTDEPCIVEPGHVLVETGAVDWTLERQDGERKDTILIGDTLVRVGLSKRVEAQFGWTPYGQVRLRDSTGVRKQSGVGDLTIALKANLKNPDGSGFSIAVTPYATLPVGGEAIGAGTWGAGLIVPAAIEISDKIGFKLTPEIAAEPNESGSGRHLAYGTAAGVEFEMSKAVRLSVEAQLIRDRDPSEHATQARGQGTLAWLVTDDTQLDAGVAFGLNLTSPDLQVQAGVAHRF